MEEIRLDTIQQVNDHYGVTTLHPLVSVVHLHQQLRKAGTKSKIYFGVYAIWLKKTKGCTLSYGRTPYDFDEETVTSFEPGQVVNMEIKETQVRPQSIGLFFHPDLLNRTHLGGMMQRYEFFSYNSTEALHLSASEVELFRQVLNLIETELQRPIDNHSRELIVSHIELLLNYCLRFYDRQFITREEINHSVVQQFDRLLREYIRTQAAQHGLPTVAYFADRCNLSTAYFGQVIKSETKLTAKEYINDRLLAAAKEQLNNESLTVTQVSENLGFEYPQHFVRFFKQRTGQTPREYRKIG